MNRFDELIKELQKKYPEDWWLKAYNSEEAQDDLFTHKFDIYRKALPFLDLASWKLFKS